MVPLLTCRRALLRIVAGLATASLAFPAVAADPAQTVAAVATQAVELVKNTTPGAARQTGFAAILLSSFDLPFMSQSALGTYWAKASEDQHTRFLKAAATAEARAYSERFGQYGGQTVSVGRVTSRPNGIFLVDSTLNQSGGNPPIKIEWELRDRGAGMRVTDVKVEGVSMIMTRRSDFSSFISRNGGDVEVLIRELESRAGR